MTSDSGPAIYLAAPLFNPMEREFNEKLADQLRSVGDVFLPQRDGALLVDLVRQGFPVGEAQEQVFKADCKAIRSACAVVAVLDGRTIDEGVAFEIGYGYGLGKPCFGLKADDRVMLPTGDNPMILKACVKVVRSAVELINLLETELEYRGKPADKTFSESAAQIGNRNS